MCLLGTTAGVIREGPGSPGVMTFISCNYVKGLSENMFVSKKMFFFIRLHVADVLNKRKIVIFECQNKSKAPMYK